LTILDFACLDPVGSSAAEATLMKLLGIAAHAHGCGAGVSAIVPKLLAPTACSNAPLHGEQGTWMFCDVQTALSRWDTEEQGPDPLASTIRTEQYLVLPIDEF